LVLTLGSHPKVAQSVRAAALEGNCTTAAQSDEIALTYPDDLTLVRKIGSIGFGLLGPEMGYFIGRSSRLGRRPSFVMAVALRGNSAKKTVGASRDSFQELAVPDS
jgi:hypothetical protein